MGSGQGGVSGSLLASADRKEGLSRAYLAAVAASAGYTLSAMDFDRDGIDVQVRAGGDMRPSLDVQLKATVRLGEDAGEAFVYSLKRRNYDLLRLPSMVPRILVVLALPDDETTWVEVSDACLVMRRCAYWTTLAGRPETSNKETVTVFIPKRNRLDPDGLKELMERARTGAIA